MTDKSNKELDKPKTPVAAPNSNQKLWGLWVFGAIIAGIIITVLFVIPAEEKKEEKEPPVTAAQTDAGRFNANIALPAQNSTFEPIEISNNLPAQPVEQSTQNNTPSDAEIAQQKSAERAKQMAIMTQLEAAQRRINSPSNAYESKSSSVKTNAASQTNLNDQDSQFGSTVNNQAVNTVSAKQQTQTDDKIFQGKVIPGVLDTAVNSDLPGLVRATITEDVYGETGRKVLLPKGSRLIGHYNSAIKTGQVRIYIMWTRAITPQKVDIALGSPGVDALGRGGLAGDVDNHFFEVFGTSILLSIMAAGAADINAPNDDTFWGNPYQYEVVEGFTDNSDRILERQLNIKPTITIDQGEPVNIMVAQDLDFTTLPIQRENVIYDPSR